MKKIITFLSFFLSFLSYCQKSSKSEFVGELFYTKETKITNQVKFEKSLGAFKTKFVKNLKEKIIEEKLNENLKIDSIGMIKIDESYNQLFDMFFVPALLENPLLQLHQKHTKDSIECYEIIDSRKINTINFIQNNSVIINNNNNKIIENFYDEEITNFIVLKNETRTINGYNCFKITYDYEILEDSSIPGFTMKGKKTLWVRENKSFNFFFFLKNKMINENYQPIEIIETFDDIEGFETTIKLENK